MFVLRYLCTHMYTYFSVCVCVCVCIRKPEFLLAVLIEATTPGLILVFLFPCLSLLHQMVKSLGLIIPVCVLVCSNPAYREGSLGNAPRNLGGARLLAGERAWARLLGRRAALGSAKAAPLFPALPFVWFRGRLLCSVLPLWPFPSELRSTSSTAGLAYLYVINLF